MMYVYVGPRVRVYVYILNLLFYTCHLNGSHAGELPLVRECRVMLMSGGACLRLSSPLARTGTNLSDLQQHGSCQSVGRHATLSCAWCYDNSNRIIT
jgi:hypothetical protein